MVGTSMPTFVLAAGNNRISLPGGIVPPGVTCTFGVNVVSASVGACSNVTLLRRVGSGATGAAAASATLAGARKR